MLEGKWKGGCVCLRDASYESGHYNQQVLMVLEPTIGLMLSHINIGYIVNIGTGAAPPHSFTKGGGSTRFHESIFFTKNQ